MNALGASPPGVVPFGIATAIPVVVATVISCAHPSTEPHEMSLQGHEEAARQASQESERLRENRCPPTTGEAIQTNAVCWTPSLASEAQRAALQSSSSDWRRPTGRPRQNSGKRRTPPAQGLLRPNA